MNDLQSTEPGSADDLMRRHSTTPFGWMDDSKLTTQPSFGQNGFKIWSGDQPLCGDRIDFYYEVLQSDQGTQSGLTSQLTLTTFFQGKSCSLCRTSASVLLACTHSLGSRFNLVKDFVAAGVRLLEQAPDDAGLLRENLPELVGAELGPLTKDFEALLTLRRFRSRRGCLLLPWNTYRQLLIEAETCSSLNIRDAKNVRPRLWFATQETPAVAPLAIFPVTGFPVTGPFVTRIAPSPTGQLHLGHVLHLAFVWMVSQKFKAKRIFRLENHDFTRCRPDYERSIIDDCLWLGLVSLDEVQSIYRQSERLSRYQAVVESLESQDLVYACRCSRKDLRDAGHLSSQGPSVRGSLGHAQEGQEQIYPGTCRDLRLPLDQPGLSLRLKIPAAPVYFADLRHGPMVQAPSTQCGDLVIKDRSGHFTYQFAVAVDDLDQGVNLIVRGDDLLSSVGRQSLVRRILGSTEPFLTYHHPLIYDERSRKLSKAARSAAVSQQRLAAVPPEHVLGDALFRGGIIAKMRAVSVAQLADLLDDRASEKGVYSLTDKDLKL